MRKTFPIIEPYGPLERKQHGDFRIPRWIRWSLIEPHREQARLNHGQTLERLAELGGLCPHELVAVLTDNPYRKVQALTLQTICLLLRRIIMEG